MLRRALVLVIVFCLVGLTALRAEERGDKFVGTWKSKATIQGFKQLMTITNDDGKWSVKGTYEKNGAVAGSFVGEDVKFDRGQLTYRSKFVKKPADSWQEHDITLRVDGDALTMSWEVKPGQKSTRTFQRTGDAKPDPKTVKNDPEKTKPSGKLEERLVGTWKGTAGGKFDEYWTVTYDGKSFKITGSYWKNGTQVGTCEGTAAFFSKDALTFRRTFDKKPPTGLTNGMPCTFKITEDGIELVVGNPKGKGELLKAAEAPKVVVKDNDQPTDPKTKPQGGEGFRGVWVGSLPDKKHQLILTIAGRKDDLVLTGWLVSADYKRVAYFRGANAKPDAEGKSMAVAPKWLEKGGPLRGDPALLLTTQPRGALRAELSDPKMTDKFVVDLTLSERTVLDRIKAPDDTVVKDPRTDDKTPKTEPFKLPPDTPAAKPFATLDAKQVISALAVSPDGKRVAIGSRHTVGGPGKPSAFTADLAVWDVEKRKQVWIKKKMAEGEGSATVAQLAFSGDGKILAAMPRKDIWPAPVRFYNAETGLELKSAAPLDLPKNAVTCLAFHPSKLQLVVGMNYIDQGQLALIDLKNGKLLWAVPRVHHSAVDGLAFSPNGEMIATFGRVADEKWSWKGAYSVKLFDAAKGTLLHDFGTSYKGIPASVLFSNDGKLLVALFGDLNKPSIVIWDTASHKEIRRITDLAGGTYDTRHNLAFLADNKTLAVPGWDKHLHLFDVTTGKRVGVYPRAFGIGVSDVFAVGDGQTLLTDKQADGVFLWKQADAVLPQMK